MRRLGRLIASSVCGLVAAAAPACAWDDGGPFSLLFHRYGDDMYRPPITPERPYWHGDDAVPPSLRWHDREIEIVDDFGFTVATRIPPPVGFAPAPVLTEAVRPAVRRHVVHRVHRRARAARLVCPPGPVSLAIAPPPPAEPQRILPPVPAPTEH